MSIKYGTKNGESLIGLDAENAPYRQYYFADLMDSLEGGIFGLAC